MVVGNRGTAKFGSTYWEIRAPLKFGLLGFGLLVGNRAGICHNFVSYNYYIRIISRTTSCTMTAKVGNQ